MSDVIRENNIITSMLPNIVSVRQDVKRDRVHGWRWIVDVFFVNVTAELERMPFHNSASILIRR